MKYFRFHAFIFAIIVTSVVSLAEDELPSSEEIVSARCTVELYHLHEEEPNQLQKAYSFDPFMIDGKVSRKTVQFPGSDNNYRFQLEINLSEQIGSSFCVTEIESGENSCSSVDSNYNIYDAKTSVYYGPRFAQFKLSCKGAE